MSLRQVKRSPESRLSPLSEAEAKLSPSPSSSCCAMREATLRVTSPSTPLRPSCRLAAAKVDLGWQPLRILRRAASPAGVRGSWHGWRRCTGFSAPQAPQAVQHAMGSSLPATRPTKRECPCGLRSTAVSAEGAPGQGVIQSERRERTAAIRVERYTAHVCLASLPSRVTVSTHTCGGPPLPRPLPRR